MFAMRLLHPSGMRYLYSHPTRAASSQISLLKAGQRGPHGYHEHYTQSGVTARKHGTTPRAAGGVFVKVQVGSSTV